jgi:hypothetical protein
MLVEEGNQLALDPRRRGPFMTDVGLAARERLTVDRLRSCAVSVLWVLGCGTPAPAWAAKLVSVATLDKDTLVVNVRDGEVIHRENGTETVNRCG